MKSFIRRIFKRGKFYTTRSSEEVILIARQVRDALRHHSSKIIIAGSILRKVKNPVDIDIVLIPKDIDKIRKVMEEKFNAKFIQGGEHRMAFEIRRVKVELYFASSKDFSAQVMSYTGPKGSSIGLRRIAKGKGLLLNQYGLFKGKKLLEGNSEKRIHKLLGVKWKRPEDRGKWMFGNYIVWHLKQKGKKLYAKLRY